MLRYTAPRSAALATALFTGGALLAGCAASSDQGIAALTSSLHNHGYRTLDPPTVPNEAWVTVTVAVGDNCEADVSMVADTKVDGEVDIEVYTNPNLGKKNVTPDTLIYQDGNYPTYAQLAQTPLIARSCIAAAQATTASAP